MDPVYYTILTMFCMMCAYFWGKRNGISYGIIRTYARVTEALGFHGVEFDDDTSSIVFIDKWGGKHNAKDAFK
jgi:hypothetical protein